MPFKNNKCIADDMPVPQGHSAVTPLELQKVLDSREPMSGFDRAAILQAYEAGLTLNELRKINSSNVKPCIDHRKKLEKEALEIGIPKAHLVGRTFQEIEKFIKREYSTGPYVEKDHRGRRIDDTNRGIVNLVLEAEKHGFVLGVFDKTDDARAALLEVPCIQVAQDSGNLICLKRLMFGYYREKTEGYVAIIQGPDLDDDIWELAKAGFTKHGGYQLQWRMPPTPSESQDNIRTAYLAWMMAGKGGSNAALSTFHTLRPRKKPPKKFLVWSWINRINQAAMVSAVRAWTIQQRSAGVKFEVDPVGLTEFEVQPWFGPKKDAQSTVIFYQLPFTELGAIRQNIENQLRLSKKNPDDLFIHDYAAIYPEW